MRSSRAFLHADIPGRPSVLPDGHAYHVDPTVVWIPDFGLNCSRAMSNKSITSSLYTQFQKLASQFKPVYIYYLLLLDLKKLQKFEFLVKSNIINYNYLLNKNKYYNITTTFRSTYSVSVLKYEHWAPTPILGYWDDYVLYLLLLADIELKFRIS